MSEAKANREAKKISKVSGLPTKVIHMGNGVYNAVVIGTADHRTSKPV